jgi:hypothetical protein
MRLSGPIRATCSTRVILDDFITSNNISWTEQIIRLLIRQMRFYTALVTSSLRRSRYIPRAIQWEPRALSPGIKRPGREADHLTPSRAEIKNAPHTSSWCVSQLRKGKACSFTLPYSETHLIYALPFMRDQDANLYNKKNISLFIIHPANT